MSADQRVTSARAYLTGIRKHKVADLPFSVLLREAAELRRQLGQVLDAVGQDGEIQGSRTASGTDPGGVTTIVPNDLGTVLGALADAATWLERRAGQWCGGCENSPTGCCEQHLDDLDAATRYRSLGRTLGDDRG